LNVARFLLDTNICIYIRRRRPPAVLARFRQLKPGEAVLSVITYGELAYGAEKSQFREQARRQLAELAGLLPVLERACQDRGPHSGHQQRTRVSAHSRAGNSELGAVIRAIDILRHSSMPAPERHIAPPRLRPVRTKRCRAGTANTRCANRKLPMIAQRFPPTGKRRLISGASPGRFDLAST
jgi:predicted nucleic acid-binding protein